MEVDSTENKANLLKEASCSENKIYAKCSGESVQVGTTNGSLISQSKSETISFCGRNEMLMSKKASKILLKAMNKSKTSNSLNCNLQRNDTNEMNKSNSLRYEKTIDKIQYLIPDEYYESACIEKISDSEIKTKCSQHSLIDKKDKVHLANNKHLVVERLNNDVNEVTEHIIDNEKSKTASREIKKLRPAIPK